MGIKWTEAKILAATFAVAAAGGGLGTAFIVGHKSQASAAPASPKLLAVAPAQVAGADTAADSSGGNNAYTLVEFLDYQCPPCRANRERVQDTVKLYGGRVRLVVRNLPLSMHRNATSAAAAAEAARKQGKFWPMHEGLLAGGALDAPEIRSLARKVGLDEKRFQADWKGSGKERVKSDLRTAEALGLDATPSFLLCTPKGQVWRLSGPAQTHDLVR